MTDPNEHFTEEALQAQHGKKVPLTAFPGGPVIGEATLMYDPETQVLGAKLRVDDPEVAKMLQGNPSSLIFRQGE